MRQPLKTRIKLVVLVLLASTTMAFLFLVNQENVRDTSRRPSSTSPAF
jgi:hypothetical protein